MWTTLFSFHNYVLTNHASLLLILLTFNVIVKWRECRFRCYVRYNNSKIEVKLRNLPRGCYMNFIIVLNCAKCNCVMIVTVVINYSAHAMCHQLVPRLSSVAAHPTARVNIVDSHRIRNIKNSIFPVAIQHRWHPTHTQSKILLFFYLFDLCMGVVYIAGGRICPRGMNKSQIYILTATVFFGVRTGEHLKLQSVTGVDTVLIMIKLAPCPDFPRRSP